MSDVTQILEAIEQGDVRATDQLLPVVYEELRVLAAQKLSHEPPGQTLQATALVHEAYLRLTGSDSQSWDSRGHFFKAAAEAMRRILVENARRKSTSKRGGGRQLVRRTNESWESLLGQVSARRGTPSASLARREAIDALLVAVASLAPDQQQAVRLYYFEGKSLQETASFIGRSHAAVRGLIYRAKRQIADALDRASKWM